MGLPTFVTVEIAGCDTATPPVPYTCSRLRSKLVKRSGSEYRGVIDVVCGTVESHTFSAGG
jgi:hypothetical protein